MARLFGTDGVRGVANAELTAELALGLSVAAARVLGESGAFAGHRPLALVGRDTRASGELLEAAVVAGLASAGVDVWRAGILPTPAIAYLTSSVGADLGVMISASHNPMPDNGIKFFAKGGYKLDDAIEDAIEERLSDGAWQRPTGGEVGRVRDYPEGFERYVEHVAGTTPHRLDGLRVLVDCAHGAAYRAAPEVLRRLGAEVTAVFAEPDGLNINDGCGSTHLDRLQQLVVEHAADAGIALDGDADRCLAVAADGEVVDGDQILAVLALAMAEQGALRADTVVATVMSNQGFRLAMQAAGVAVVDTAVGDRYVLEAMKAGGYSLGGEQSGHLILLDHCSTGDGLLTAVHLLARAAAAKVPLAELAAVVQRLPQVLLNVPGVDKTLVASHPAVQDAVAAAERELGATGRVLLRPSGTEPLVRVMVEAATAEQADSVARRLAAVVGSELALQS